METIKGQIKSVYRSAIENKGVEQTAVICGKTMKATASINPFNGEMNIQTSFSCGNEFHSGSINCNVESVESWIEMAAKADTQVYFRNVKED